MNSELTSRLASPPLQMVDQDSHLSRNQAYIREICWLGWDTFRQQQFFRSLFPHFRMFLLPVLTLSRWHFKPLEAINEWSEWDFQNIDFSIFEKKVIKLWLTAIYIKQLNEMF